MPKTYPFSVQKHAHDIEFLRNRTFNIMGDMQCGEIPMDDKRYDELEARYDALTDLMSAVMCSGDGRIAWLTGKQYGLAKEAVIWAAETRAESASRRQMERGY